MNKKAFTLVELLVVVLILGILSAMAVTSYNKYLRKSQDKTFKIEEDNMKSAVSNAYIQYLSNKDNRLKDKFYNLDTNGNTITVSLKELVNYDYIRKIKNPYNTNETCDLDNSYVEITSNDSTSLNKDFEYKVCLVCGEHRSDDC